MPRPYRSRSVVSAGLVLLAVGVSIAGCQAASPPSVPRAAPSAAVEPSSPAPPPPPTAAPAPPGLPRISYADLPAGFPRDPAPTSLTPVVEGLHPERKLPVYDAPGGRPRALLPRTISGLEVVVPIVARRTGWVAVLLPSANRRIGWMPTTGWSPRPLRDQLVVHLDRHELVWLRDGSPRASWTVAVGAARTPTPPGRTFVLGRTGTHGTVYAGLDALVLGAVPDDRAGLAPGLQGAHTGIHGWYSKAVFGRSVSNGCVRLPPAAQRLLLQNLVAGTTVHIID